MCPLLSSCGGRDCDDAGRFAALVRPPLRILRGRAERLRRHHPGGRAAPVADRYTAIVWPHCSARSAAPLTVPSYRSSSCREVPPPSRLEPTMPGRRFSDLERQLVDVLGAAVVTARLQA